MLGVAARRIVHAIRNPRNNADEAIAPKPGGTALSGRSAVSRRSPMGAYHWRRVASCISSRKASVATTRDLFRGSLNRHMRALLCAAGLALMLGGCSWFPSLGVYKLDINQGNYITQDQVDKL